MARTKDQLLDEAKKSGRVGDDVDAEDVTVAQLETLLGGDVPASGWVPSHRTPQIAPDGHVNLSKEDIDGRP